MDAAEFVKLKVGQIQAHRAQLDHKFRQGKDTARGVQVAEKNCAAYGIASNERGAGPDILGMKHPVAIVQCSDSVLIRNDIDGHGISF
ncbi:hypothetical protein ASD15_07650 [Massilia sp. Root351]|nr:hypothetical protein ASD15_07650 [Massilia sp. Root351]